MVPQFKGCVRGCDSPTTGRHHVGETSGASLPMNDGAPDYSSGLCSATIVNRGTFKSAE